MIRYPVTKKQLQGLITAKRPKWLANAAERTKVFKQKGIYEEESTIWSEIKPVYMQLQGEGKCAFCERQMEDVVLGAGEQDVEHFRPKGSVKAWKATKRLTDAGVKFTTVSTGKEGYHLLPYHILNYAASCKPCNSTLKKDRFPIAGKYNLVGDDPEKMKTEKPFLIYPIGNIDEDPEDLIEFQGASPVPKAKSGHRRLRALVTIEFFRLDDPAQRKNLYRDRVILIMALHTLLEKTKTGTAAQKRKAKSDVDAFLQPTLRHLNCARSYVRLFSVDPAAAGDIYNNAVQFITSSS